MGGRGGSSGMYGSRTSLTPISVDQGWLYKPMDNSQIFANPIKYVGNDLAKDIVNNVYSFSYQAVEEKMENVNLSSLKSVQAFVTEQGLADLRGLASEERARLIIKNCAHPDFKEPLTDFLEYSLKHAKGVHMPLALSKAFEMHNRYLETGKMLPEKPAHVILAYFFIVILVPHQVRDKLRRGSIRRLQTSLPS